MSGKYGITKESQIIDKGQIEFGCSKIDHAARKFTDAAASVEKAAAVMNNNALSIDGATLQAAIIEVADAIKEYETYINNGTNSIREVATQVYKEQKVEYHSYLAEKEKEERERRKAEKKKKNQG